MEPINSTARYDSRKLDNSPPERFTNRRKAKHDMQVVASSLQEVFHNRFLIDGSLLIFSLHDWRQLRNNFLLFVSVEKIGNYSAGKYVVQIFQENFLFDVQILENECGACKKIK